MPAGLETGLQENANPSPSSREPAAAAQTHMPPVANRSIDM
ncbi:hypothetical protein [Dissulfurimicrobium sp.]